MNQSWIVIQCMGYADPTVPCPYKGKYLQWYDPNGDELKDIGGWTDDPLKAMLFDSAEEALVCWRQVRTVDPVRPDGRPNRPLTAFSVIISQVQLQRESEVRR